MKHLIRLYRTLKPVCIYTSYLFTSLTVLYLTVNELTGRRLPFTVGFLWGLFAFSMGSIGLQKLLLDAACFRTVPYPIRLALYGCAAMLWGYVCLNLGSVSYTTGHAKKALLPALVIGGLCCMGLEIFNRYRAHMYNTLLEQYKRRKRL